MEFENPVSAGDPGAVETAKARLAAIVEASHDAIVSNSLAGAVTSWNGAAARMFGYAAEEMIGGTLRRLIPSDRQSEEDEFLASVARGERIGDYETVRLHKDGRLVDVSVTVSPMYDDAGKIIGVSKILRDITERKRFEERILESERKFRTLADNISQLAWMADEKGWIVWYNQRWYDYTGTTLEQMQGWGWKQVHHPDHVDRVVQRIQYSWDSGEPWEDTFPLCGADGEYRWFLSRALAIRDDQGKIVCWFGTNTDITEQKQREEQIRVLAGEVNHRSKNMLALVQVIARRTAATGQNDFLERFGARIQALAASQDLLINTNWQGVRFEQLVRSQLAHFPDLIGTRIRLEGGPAPLKASAAQVLGMAIHELGTNAGKYGALSNDTGRVHISWEIKKGDDGAPRFSVAWIESGGPPVAPPDRQGFGSTVIGKMSEMSLEASVELDYAPTGVIWRLDCAESQVVEGAAPRVNTETRLHTPAPRPSKRVLVVEDEALVAMDLVGALEDAGFVAVGPANSVAQALELLNNIECDSAVLDVNLGAETAEPIAERLKRDGVPFVVVSGYSREQQPAIFKMAKFFPKPLNTPLLVTEIHHCMENREGRSEKESNRDG